MSAPHLTMRATWVFELDPTDARLVLRALAGRLRTDEERAAAADLGERLRQLRVAASVSQSTQLQGEQS